MKKQTKENLRHTLLQIMRPYAKFVVKIQDGIFLKTRFGVQKLRDDKSGLYLKNANKKKLYLHRWNKTSSFGGPNMPPPPPPPSPTSPQPPEPPPVHPEPRSLLVEFNRELNPASFQVGDLVRFIDSVTGEVALDGQIFEVTGTQFNHQTSTLYHRVRPMNVIGLHIPVPRDLLRDVYQ